MTIFSPAALFIIAFLGALGSVTTICGVQVLLRRLSADRNHTGAKPGD